MEGEDGPLDTEDGEQASQTARARFSRSRVVLVSVGFVRRVCPNG